MQTLFISDLIYVPNAGGGRFGYGQLQVGFLIACMRDTCQRAALMREELNREIPPGLKTRVMRNWDRVYDVDQSDLSREVFNALPLQRRASVKEKERAKRRTASQKQRDDAVSPF